MCLVCSKNFKEAGVCLVPREQVGRGREMRLQELAGNFGFGCKGDGKPLLV